MSIKHELEPISLDRNEKFYDYRGVRFKTIICPPSEGQRKNREWVYIMLWPGINCVFTADDTIQSVEERLHALQLERYFPEHIRREESRGFDTWDDDQYRWKKPSVHWLIGCDFQHDLDYTFATYAYDGYGEEYLKSFAVNIIDALHDAGLVYEQRLQNFTNSIEG